MKYIDLKKLPVDHPLRNTPLAKIGAQLQNNAAPNQPWRSVLPAWHIAGNIFNDLTGAWMQYANWRVREKANV